MSGHKKMAAVFAVAIVAVAVAAGASNLRFKFHGGSLHIATFKRYANGTDTNYFLEIPIWFKGD